MNDTSYKLRSELLSMAKDICEFNIYLQRNAVELALDAAKNMASVSLESMNEQDATTKALLDRYNAIAPLSIDTVLAYARQLNDFLSNNDSKDQAQKA